MPLPRLRNMRSAYALSSSPCSESTVATTTTSPVVSCSARISESSCCALSASITWAKSFTGRVSSGVSGCAHACAATKSTKKASHKERGEHISWRASWLRAPGIDSMREVLDRSEVLGKEASRIDGGHAGRVLEREEVGDELLGNADSLCAESRRFATITGRDAVQPCDVPQQRGEGRRGCCHEAGHRTRLAAGFNERLAQVHEMTLDLCFAGTAQIVRRNRDIDERVVPEHDVMRPDDLAILERERIERSPEFGLGQDERCGDVRPLPARRARRARVQIVGCQAGDECQTGERCVRVTFNMGSIRGKRSEPVAEHTAKIAGQRICGWLPG